MLRREVNSPLPCADVAVLLLLQGAWHGKGPLEAYEMANYWDTKFKMNTFGQNVVEVGDVMLGPGHLCSACASM